MFIVCLVAGAFATWAMAASQTSLAAHIDALEVAVRAELVEASLRLDDAFDAALFRRVDSGLPTRLVYQFELQKDRSSWFDQSVADSQLQVIAMFNAVTGEYLINFKHDGRLIESRVVRDHDALRAAMTELDAFPAFSTDSLDASARYRLRVRAELGTRNLLAFIPRTVETPWAESPKFTLATSRQVER